MEIYIRPQGTLFQHDDPQNDGRFQPSKFYYVSYVNLPADYYGRHPMSTTTTQSVGHEAALTTVRSYGYDYEDAQSVLAQVYEGAGKWWTVPVPNGGSLVQVKYNRNRKTYNFK